MGELLRKLEDYAKSSAYPFHMPGHKRRWGTFFNPYQMDITEIGGFDNLHHAGGLLLDAQRRAAALYGAEETYFLINGSTAGVLSAVSCCCGHTLVMARNSHKSAYHSALVRNLDVVYLYPDVQEEYLLNGGISPEAVEETIKKHPEAEAILITSPTYDGIVSDIGKIAEIAHRYRKPLIVDEAHGAHFGFSEKFPESSVHLGADIVIHGLHKTLPSYTQTALLHVNGELVDREKLRFFLQVYQTSSPSYVLMAGMDDCILYMEREGKRELERFACRLDKFYAASQNWKNIRLVDSHIVGKDHIADFDRSKLIFSLKDCALLGNEFQKLLREEYGLELEMASPNYGLALTSLCDVEEGFERLGRSVAQIDKNISPRSEGEFPLKDMVTKNEIFYTINQAFKAKKRTVKISGAGGNVSGEFLYLYPPGIPLVVPGERIDNELISRLTASRENGFELQGMSDFTGKTIKVLDTFV